MTRERGFALVAVLWTVALISFLVAQLTIAGRTQARIAANLRANAVAEAAADGAVHQALLRLLEGTWQPGSPAQQLLVGSVPVKVWAENEAHKLNPNLASADVMRNLLGRIGVDRVQAASLATSIFEWRGSNRRTDAARTKMAPYLAAGRAYGPPADRSRVKRNSAS
jgi:general secretion pathway protein K